MILQQQYAVHRDGHVETRFDFTPCVQAILDRLTRCNYMVEMHQQGIQLNYKRIEELRAELAWLGSQQ